MASASIFWLTWAVVINPRPLIGLALIGFAITVASVFRVLSGQKAWLWLYRVGLVAVAGISMWKYPFSTSMWAVTVAGLTVAFMSNRREVVQNLRLLWGV